jgi:hypothetical protein
VYCGARQVSTIPIEQLVEPFSRLLAEYVEESYREHEFKAGEHHWASRQLHSAIQQDWTVFSNGVVEKNDHLRLLEPILATARNSRGDAFKPDSWVLNFSLQAMRTEWRFWCRMFHSGSEPYSPTLDVVREHLLIPGTLENQVGNHLSYFAVLVEQTNSLFRARPGCETNGEAHLPHDDLGPNPNHPASRANGEGQRSIYLSETETTAVAEVRRPAGSFVSIGEFVVRRGLTIVDLCQSFNPPNPFVTVNLAWLLDLTHLLREIAETMSKPAQTPLDYSATQLLANIARAVGYDGIRYPSAINSLEPNIVLFESDVVQKKNSWVNILKAEGFERV